MIWWIGAGLVWLLSAVCIFTAMWEVWRGKSRTFSRRIMSMYGFHGVTALLALWLAVQAVSR